MRLPFGEVGSDARHSGHCEQGRGTRRRAFCIPRSLPLGLPHFFGNFNASKRRRFQPAQRCVWEFLLQPEPLASKLEKLGPPER